MVLRARHAAVEQPPAAAWTVVARPRSLASPRCRLAVTARVRLFVLGVAAIALHVLDDSFLQPPPGTSAGDHLVSGLVPLAVLALAAWTYPRAARRPPRSDGAAVRRVRDRRRSRGRALHDQGRRVRRRLHRPARDPRRAAAARPRRRHAVERRGARTATAHGATCAARCSAPQASPSRCSSSLR